MALTHLIKHIYSNGNEEVIRRGKKIVSLGNIELVDHDHLMASVTFRVKDDVYNMYYKVYIQKYADAKNINLRCTCAYNLGDICKHETAGLFKLQDLADRNLLHNANIEYQQLHTVAKMKNIDTKVIKMLSSPGLYDEAHQLLKAAEINITQAKDEKVESTVTVTGSTYNVILQKNDERNFDTSCNCAATEHPLCEHKIILFLHLLQTHGANYFDTIINWDKQKNKLLAIYGYSLTDDIKGKFEFIYKEGKPFLKLLDPSIKRVATPTPTTAPPPAFTQVAAAQQTQITQNQVTPTINNRLGLVVHTNQKQFPYFVIDIVSGEVNDTQKKYLGRVEKQDLTKYIDTQNLNEDDKTLLQQVRKLQNSEIARYIDKNSPFGGIWDSIVQTETQEIAEDTKALIAEYLHPKIKKIFTEQSTNPFTYLITTKGTYKTENLEEIEFSDIPLQPIFIVEAAKDGFNLQFKIKIQNTILNLQDNECSSSLIFLYDNMVYTWDKAEDVLEAEKYVKTGTQFLPSSNWAEILKTTILPLTQNYQVEFEEGILQEIKNVTPTISVQLVEKGDFLLFQPQFDYKGLKVKLQDRPSITVPDGNKLLRIYRNAQVEETFMQDLQNLHSSFTKDITGDALILKGAEVLKNNWFFLFVDAMKEKKIPVYGFEQLKNYKFNTAKPQTAIHVSSGLDWFDAKVEINFEGQKVGIDEIKRALANTQSFVQLADGSLGILPEEWLKKYALLFKMGDGKNNQLRLSKYHLSVIDDLYEQRDEEELTFALDEKFEKLKAFKDIPNLEAPAHLTPILRPYQKAGFQWLNFLQEVGWGGILADDMGLGKTIQALTTLSNYKSKNGGLQAIVVCPTTLIYNWRNETEKFTPEVTWTIHHGSARTNKIEELQKVNIIITSYGTLRSDIQLFLKIHFDYVVLDESQAIKNPASKVTRAACLLNAKNKMCMSGTPLQNNTFDIFAQMNFLNPGLLGNMEFFRNEFATLIDKFGDRESKEHLRKLLYPFILRRTKEQVAKDLPEKTEQILFCEMLPEQRRIYDAYRNSFRDKILGTIEAQGIQRSQLTILQGLMKLRQICDSPAILNEEEKFPNTSIKLEELTREITENIGNHKALIFSQFLGMLALIKEKLIADGIPFEYFDGSTSAKDREIAINNFQENESCRVFLISLKAGGVGLNLTAADYVYIVDPWWNPAVEQQAIDRTHRIGQTKNIFAYRMICVDTIEDKILQLQERKKALAKDLISDEDGFVKALTKQDVEYLFS
jgi:hypothetical protein